MDIVSRRTKFAPRIALFFTFVVPSSPLGWPFFQLWVPPDFFADFSQFFWEYPQIFFRFLSKKMKNSIFFEKKSEKNLDFFLENFDFLDKKSEKIWIFSLEISKFLTKIWKNLGVLPTFLTKSAKKNGGTQRWKNGHPRGALGTSKVKKRRI